MRRHGGTHMRLVAALAAALLIHAWLVHGYGERERSRPATAGTPFHATLIEAAAPQPKTEPERAERADYALERAQSQPAPAPLPRALPAPSVAQPVAVQRGVDTERTVTAPTQVSALPQPQDPTYYNARSLDEFPARLTPLNPALVRAAAQDNGGSARATLLIDEAGMVNEVTSVEGLTHAGAEQALSDLFLAARFSPGRKDGRVVKARVLVQLNY